MPADPKLDDEDEKDSEQDSACDEEREVECSACQGSGIGQFGDPNKSRCSACKGMGSFIVRGCDEEDDDNGIDARDEARIDQATMDIE